MRTHTQEFKDEIKTYGREFDDEIRIYEYENNLPITHYTPDIEQENINSVTYSFDGGLLKSVMQTITCDINNNSSATWLKEGRYLSYKITLANQSLYFGGYINKIEEQKDTNSLLVTCYDDLIFSMADYETPYTDANRTTRLTFPTTLGNYLSAICNHIGIVLESSTFTNSTQQVTSEHYLDADGNSLGYTFRDVLDDIAEASGSFISIKNNMLHVHTPYATNDTIDEDYLKDTNVTINKKYGPINVVILSRNDVDNLKRPTTLPADPCEIKITNNPILDQTNRENFIDGIYNNLNGLEFYLNDMQLTGVLYYEIGDKYNVTIDNTTYPCLMLNDSFKRENGLSEYIYTNEPKTSVSDYKYASTTDKLEKTARNAYFLADKAEGTASMIVEGIGSNGQVTGASVIASINGDTSQLKLNANKVYINGVEFDDNNNMTINKGTINIEQYPGDRSLYTYYDDTNNHEKDEAEVMPTGLYLSITDTSNSQVTSQAHYGVNDMEVDQATIGYLTTTNREDSASNGYTYDQYGNMQHKSSNTGTSWNMKDNAGNYVVRVYPEDTPKRVVIYAPSLTINEGNISVDATNSFQTTLFGSNNASYRIKPCRAENSAGAPTFGLAAYAPTLAIATGDTHMFLSANYVTDAVVIGAGNADKINWKKVVLLEGDTLVSTSFNIGSSVTINNLSSYKFLEIFYGRGNDYGQASQKVLVASNTMTNISIMYISGSTVRRHTAHVSWNTSTNKVTFVSMLEENITTSGSTSSIVTSSNTYDRIIKIIGHKY